MNISEEKVRELVVKGIKELGAKATPDNLRQYVENAMQNVSADPQTQQARSGERAILTAFGVNHPGVVSTISTALSNRGCDILDLSQKIMQEFFTMIMLIDLAGTSSTIKDVQEEMNKIAEMLKIKIYLQHEDVFRYMHRI